MSFSPPIIALGFPIQNCSMQLPPELGNVHAPAGWTYSLIDGTWLSYRRNDECPPDGNRRWYQYKSSGAGNPTFELRTSRVPNGRIGYYSNAYWTAAIIYKASFGASSTYPFALKVYLEWLGPTGAILSATGPIVSVTSSFPSDQAWTVACGAVLGLSAVGAVSARAKVVVDGGNAGGGSAADVGIAGVYVGFWDGASGYAELPTLPFVGGTDYGFSGPDGHFETDIGDHGFVGTSRAWKPRTVSLRYARISDAGKLMCEHAYAMNRGRNSVPLPYADSMGGPGGGVYPILLIPRMDGMPFAVLGDWVGPFGFTPANSSVLSDPAYWQGTVTIAERR